MSGYLSELAAASGLFHVDYQIYFLTQGPEGKKRQSSPEFTHTVFDNRGYIYGPLRYFLPIPRLGDYRIILVVRDPRDILTSQYYSIRNSHPQVSARMIDRRSRAQSMTIDEHVRNEADRFLRTFDEYIDQLCIQPDVLVLKYEDMIRDFPSFLSAISDHCGLHLNEEQLKVLDRQHEFAVIDENPHSHKRNVKAGDYRNKLQPETIEWLNLKFKRVLRHFNYSIE